MTEEGKAKVLAEADGNLRAAKTLIYAGRAQVSLNEEDEIIRSLGGVRCNCSPETNGHMSGPIGPAGSCPNCGFEGPLYRQAIEYYAATHNGHNPYTEASAFNVVPLAPLMKKGVPDPVLLCHNLLYEGGLHSIAGPPDCGKSTLALWWSVDQLRHGKRVVFLDEEGGEEIVTERLVALGATLDELENLVYVPFPGRQWSASDIAELLRLTEGASLMLVDSSAAFMARAGWDENLARDVTNFWSRVLTPVARQSRAAVVVIDHVKKETEPGTRYARGSGGKLAALDVQIMIEMLRPFSRTQDGVLKYHVSKDRRGWLHRYWKVRMHTRGGLIEPEFQHDELDEAQEGQIPGPPARKKIYEVLSDIPAGYREIVDAINGRYGHFLSRQTVSTELNELARAGYADSIEQGREILWVKVR